ncbi:GntR family transcriptional regulator [Kaistia sp. MMO-174]|uniref:GntR family transcriptional regulator n=1 Tax=Kaistia sp. MMO-174 TaxID=3081256 RepID=UPI00301B613E
MARPSPRIEVAHEALRQAIIEQALKPGTKLPEDVIGEQFAMSRTLVRAVLAKLEAEGLVDAHPKRTATVAQPTLAEARDVFGVRRALEAEAVRLVAKRWQPAFASELEGLLRQEDEARSRQDERVSIHLAGEFHLRLAHLSGNALLERYLRELITRCSLILAVFGRPHSSDCAIEEHSALIAALSAGKAEEAVAIMNTHIGAVERRALLGGDDEKPAALGDVLSHYAAAVTARQAPKPTAKPSKTASSK